jgi:CheY-like chemotaxis protein
MGKKILLADDSITFQKVIELTFSDEDFEVVTVGNGRLAVEKVQDVRPDLVLCDIIMPEKDGYEVCDFIKKTPSLAHIPVLLLTGAFEPFDQDRASRVGCDGFLAKPFEPQTLIAKVKDLLNQAGTRTVAPTRASAAAAPAPPPAPAPAPPPPVMSAPAPEAEPNFIPDEPLEETPTMITPSYTEIGKSVYHEPPPPPAPATAAVSPEELSYVDDLPEPDELMDVSPEESATLQGDTAEADDVPSPWAQPTVEVPLETRAQASVESAQPSAEPSFDEVFEEDEPAAAPAPAAPVPSHAHAPEAPDAHLGAGSDDFGYVRTQDVIGSPAAPSVPSAAAPETVREGFGWVRQADLPGTPAAPPRHDSGSHTPRESPSFTGMGDADDESPAKAPEPVRRAPEPEKRAPEPLSVAPPPMESSFASVTPASAPSPAVAPSAAAEVGVPVDMVEKIAQRVVAQISEKVIREIAWEVIPDLAENLIKKEIDKLKAELQQT